MDKILTFYFCIGLFLILAFVSEAMIEAITDTMSETFYRIVSITWVSIPSWGCLGLLGVIFLSNSKNNL